VNTGFVEQRVTLVVSMKPTNGPLSAQSQTFHVELAPLQSYAFTPRAIGLVPSERATLDIRISGRLTRQPGAFQELPSGVVTLRSLVNWRRYR